MKRILKNSWALFTGYAMIMVAQGLQGNLLGIRSVIENFNILATGVLMSAYFLGYFTGAKIVPNLVAKVGHIRVFAAFASMASLSVLVHAVFVNPFVWTVARFVTGLSIIGIFIVTESWLNDRANNRTRGKILSVYMFITFISIACGSLLLNFSSPEKYEPFILISLMWSIALVPILLIKRQAPKFKKITSIKLVDLYKTSPMGVVSSFFTGFVHSAIFTLLAVYAAAMHFTIFEISLLLFLITISGAIFQWPIGYYSDLHDRRLIIVICSLAAAFFSLIAIIAVGPAPELMFLAVDWEMNKLVFFIFVTLFAGVSLPIYSLNLAHTNDFIPKEKFVAAGGGLQLVFGVGAIIGPILCTIFMSRHGANGFFIFLIIFHVLIGLFGIYRMTRRKVKDNPESSFTPLQRNVTPLGMELDPTTAADLSSTEKK
jgi:MFS family permease